MATLKLSVLKDKIAKDGTSKIRIAISHKTITKHIVTRFTIDNLNIS